MRSFFSLKWLFVTGSLLSIVSISTAYASNQHAPSKHTQKAHQHVLETLPFSDTRDFDNAQRGFLSTLKDPLIRDDNNKPVFTLGLPGLKLDQKAPVTINPSLWRQAQLTAMHGLYEVTPGIYQVRGFDLANISFIRGKTGWIVIDPLTSTETAAAALKLLNEQVEALPVSAVIITHSHVDHFGGVKGVVSEADVRSGDIPLIAPKDFFTEAVSENVIAGLHMGRRATYMYGFLLPKSPTGAVGSGLGTYVSTGSVTILKPNQIISKEVETHKVDGVEMVFYFTPGAEATSEMMFYIPKYKALMQAEEINHTLHNTYTLRGAKVRDALLWSKYIQQMVNTFGDEVEISFGSHHWPVWGNTNILDFWRGQRDTYRYIHDETLRLANKGLTMLEIAETLKLPDSLASQFANRGYYGTVSHNVKSQYQLYYGWFSGNPSELNELPPEQEGRKFVEYMGGAKKLLKKAKRDYDKGEYRWVATALNHLVFAQPDNQQAKELLADTLQQMGYQAESAPWRNFYLSGAQELRQGITPAPMTDTMSADIQGNIDLETFLDFLGMRINHPIAAQREMPIRMNVTALPSGYPFTLSVENGVINYNLGQHVEEASTSVELELGVINQLGQGLITIDEALASDRLNIDGDPSEFLDFLGLLDRFDLWFNIVTP